MKHMYHGNAEERQLLRPRLAVPTREVVGGAHPETAVASQTTASPKFTSQDLPLRVACVNLPAPNGVGPNRMLGFCMALGRKKQKDGYAWARDLHEDVRRLRAEYGATVVVTMMPREELVQIGARDLPAILQKEGIEWVHFPIVDKWVPAQGFAAFMQQARELAVKLRQGARVVLHCNGGKGRSALMTAAVVYAYTQNTEGVKAFSMSDSIAEVRKPEPGALKNPLQTGYLHTIAIGGY